MNSATKCCLQSNAQNLNKDDGAHIHVAWQMAAVTKQQQQINTSSRHATLFAAMQLNFYIHK